MTDNNGSPRFCIVSHSFARIAWPIVSHEREATCIYIYIALVSNRFSRHRLSLFLSFSLGSFFIEDGKRTDRVGFIRGGEEKETSLERLENRTSANTCAPFTRIGTRARARAHAVAIRPLIPSINLSLLTTCERRLIRSSVLRG